MYVSPAQVEELARRFGRPAAMRIEQPIAAGEAETVRGSQRARGRSHDLTVLAFDPAGRLVVIRKPSFPHGAYRAPSGAALPGEPLADAAVREMREETGLLVALHRYVLRVEAMFLAPDGPIAWTTHVLTAAAPAAAPAPLDVDEIAEARWCSREELQGPIRSTLLRTGRGLFRYRVALTDAALALIELHPALVPRGPERAD